jgi:hypothetical protein
MARFDVEEGEAESDLRRAIDCSTGASVILERGVRAERVRRFNRIPANPAIAPHQRIRLEKRVHLVHPAPLELEVPTDDFEIAHAIGSLLDGLTWLHEHGFTHGAIDEYALTSGPTGGRLSMAGALSRRGDATTADDVYGAAALAFELLVGEAPGADAHDDPRLDFCTSPAMTEGVRAGLDPDPARRPSAAELATMVRGEWLIPVVVTRSFVHPIARVRALATSASARARRIAADIRETMSPSAARLSAGLGAAAAVLVVVATLAAADRPGRASAFDASTAATTTIGADSTATATEAPAPTLRAHRPSVAVEDLIAATAASMTPTTTVAVLAESTVAASLPAPTTTVPPPPPTLRVLMPPSTTAAPPPPPPTAVPTTAGPTTTRALASPTTTRATTTTRITTTMRTPTTTRATTTTRRNRGRD